MSADVKVTRSGEVYVIETVGFGPRTGETIERFVGRVARLDPFEVVSGSGWRARRGRWETGESKTFRTRRDAVAWLTS